MELEIYFQLPFAPYGVRAEMKWPEISVASENVSLFEFIEDVTDQKLTQTESNIVGEFRGIEDYVDILFHNSVVNIFPK
jgi:hypothetical protein